MTDAAWIASGIGAFAVVTWLLALSYLLGRYSARIDDLEKHVCKIVHRIDSIPTVESRLSVIEDRIKKISE
jgi:hypothetical protein